MDAEHVTNKAIALIKLIHNPPLGAKEFSGGFMPERVDAILFATGKSFLIETKISRADFLADKKKAFRIDPSMGIGTYRYYACPHGLIQPEELPQKWGLIWVHEGNKRAEMSVGFGGSVKVGEEKDPIHGWNNSVFQHFGTPRPNEEDCISPMYKDPKWPAKRFRFEMNDGLERQYLFALATRLKTGKFNDNIL